MTFIRHYSDLMSDRNLPPSRRERLFEATRDELAVAARELLIEGGLEAVTMRAVATKLGMTAPAVYRYFESREELIGYVVKDLYGDLGEYLLGVRDRDPSAPVIDRLVATSRAFRHWALDHRAEFGLLFGAPVPGVLEDAETKPHDGRASAFGQVWFELFAEIDQLGNEIHWDLPISPALAADVERFIAKLGASVRTEAVLVYIYCWQTLYGAVCTEAFGHLRWGVTDAGELFEFRLHELRALLGFDPVESAAG